MKAADQYVPKVSVIIPVFNSPLLIRKCLESLLPQDWPDYEVIVVDDGSTDETPEEVLKYDVRLIRNEHRGISAARNKAVKSARGDIILGLDADLQVPRDLIKRMIAPLANEKTGVTMAWWDVANADNLVAALIFRTYEYFVRHLEEPDFLWSYCFAVKKKIFEEVGGFSEMLLVGEDVDFAHRVTGAGYKIVIIKDLRVWHYFRDSLWGHLKRHFLTARTKFCYVLDSRKVFDQRGYPVEYLKLLLHFLLIVSIPALFWKPQIFFILLLLALSGHLKITLWSMKKGLKFALILPFEFVTKIAWVAGVIQGAFWKLKGYRPTPADL